MKNIESYMTLIAFKGQIKSTQFVATAYRKVHANMIARARVLAKDPDKVGEAQKLRDMAAYPVTSRLEEGSHARRIQHLAYCFMKGRTYRECENKSDLDPTTEAGRVTIEAFAQQIQAAVGVYDRMYRLGGDKPKVVVKTWLEKGDVTKTQIEDGTATSAKAAA